MSPTPSKARAGPTEPRADVSTGHTQTCSCICRAPWTSPWSRQAVSGSFCSNAVANPARFSWLLMLAPPAGRFYGDNRDSRRKGLLSHLQPRSHTHHPYQPRSVSVLEVSQQARQLDGPQRAYVAPGDRNTAAAGGPDAPLPSRCRPVAGPRLLHVPGRLRRRVGHPRPVLPHACGLDLLHLLHLHGLRPDAGVGGLERQPGGKDQAGLE